MLLRKAMLSGCMFESTSHNHAMMLPLSRHATTTMKVKSSASGGLILSESVSPPDAPEMIMIVQ